MCARDERFPRHLLHCNPAALSECTNMMMLRCSHIAASSAYTKKPSQHMWLKCCSTSTRTWLPGIVRDSLTVLSLWENIDVIVEIHSWCINLSLISTFLIGQHFHPCGTHIFHQNEPFCIINKLDTTHTHTHTTRGVWCVVSLSITFPFIYSYLH